MPSGGRGADADIAAALDALVAAGINSSDGDMAFLRSELKAREAKAAKAAKAAVVTTPTHAASRAPVASDPAPSISRIAPAAVLTGRRASDATKEIFKHVARLKYQDEDWKARDEALQRLQVLIADGALACDGFVVGFAENLRDLVNSCVTQLYDLRSVVVRSAVATLKVRACHNRHSDNLGPRMLRSAFLHTTYSHVCDACAGADDRSGRPCGG